MKLIKKIALFGAAGAIGQSVAAVLGAEQIPYRVVGRNRNSLQQAFRANSLAEIITWNPEDPQSVRDAAKEIDTIIYLVGVDYAHFELHPILMKKTIDGAIAAGVRRILLIGTVYPYGMPKSSVVTEEHTREPHTFRGRMRKEQEDILFDAHTAGRIQACEIRLPDFYGPSVDKSFLWSAFQAAKAGKRAQLIGPIDKPHQYVFVPDVGPLLCRMLKEDRTWGQVWHFAGSGTIVTRSLVEQIFAAARAKPKFRVANKLMLSAFGLFNPMLKGLAEMNYLVSDPILMNDDRLVSLLGNIQRTSYEDGIRKTLASMP